MKTVEFLSLESEEKRKEIFKLVETADTQFFTQLIENGVDLSDFRDENGNNLLHEAVRKENFALIKILVNVIDVNLQNNEGKTPLHLSSENSRFLIAKQLIKKGAILKKDSNNEDPLQIAEKNDSKALILLFNSAFSRKIKESPETAEVFHAIQEHNVSLIKNMIDEGKNMRITDSFGATPLHVAVSLGDTEIVKILVKVSDVNAMDGEFMTPLQIAVNNEKSEIQEILRENGGIQCYEENDAAFSQKSSCSSSSKPHIKYAFDDEVPATTIPDVADVTGFVLSSASDNETNEEAADSEGGNEEEDEQKERKSQEKAKEQKEQQETSKKKRRKSKIPIDIFKAIEEKDAKAVSKYVKRGGELMITNEKGETPLFCAIKTDDYRVIKPLCTKQTISYLEKRGFHSLCFFIEKAKNAKLVRLFALSGASYKHKNDKQMMPMDVALALPDSPEKDEFIYSTSLALFNASWAFIKFITENEELFKKYELDYIRQSIIIDNAEILVVLIQKGVDINQEIEGLTPIHLAIKYGSSKAVETLLKMDCELRKMDDGINEITRALQSKNFHKIILARVVAAYQKKLYSLIEKPKEFEENFPDVFLQFPAAYFLLERGIVHLQLETVKFLISKGLSVKCVGGKQRTLLHLASMVKGLDTENRGKMLNIIIYLKEQGADINAKDAYNRLPLHYAAQIGYIEIVAEFTAKSLCSMKDCIGKTPIDLAANDETRDFLTMINDRVCEDPTIPEESEHRLLKMLRTSKEIPLEIIKLCATKDYYKALKFLIEKGLDVTGENTYLHVCAKNNSYNCCKLLVLNGANVNTKDEEMKTPLHYAFEKGNIDLAKLLINCGARNTKDSSGKQPTDYADKDSNDAMLLVKQYKSLIYILKHFNEENDAILAAEKELSYSFGYILLEKAVKMNSPRQIETLVKCAKVNINSLNPSGATILHAACFSKLSNDIIELLLSLGCKKNIKAEHGYTALHYAVLANNADAVRILIKHKADTGIKDDEGKTPNAIAKEQGYTEIIKLFASSPKKVHHFKHM